MKVRAPGKLVLSGEHAVVYGKPALAMAVNRYVTVSIWAEHSDELTWHFADLSYKRSMTWEMLGQLKQDINEKYARFQRGDYTIRDVLQHPAELAQYALSLCLDTIPPQLKSGMRIHMTSTIPIGCGMGSSAATVLSVLCALLPNTPDIDSLALHAENLQHGISSGLDLHVSRYGGCFYKENTSIARRFSWDIPFYLVNTGIPQTSTGECVAAAAHHFKQSSIGNDFAAVTEAMDKALQNNCLADFRQAIAANHILLSKIGVVPERAKQFITHIKQHGGVAKTCGAGAVAGDNAGIIMVVTEDASALSQLCRQFGYDVLPVNVEARGVHEIL